MKVILSDRADQWLPGDGIGGGGETGWEAKRGAQGNF